MLIFDSGVGGLSILKHIKKILPKTNYIYMLDNEAFPYGNKEKFFIIERSINIINTIKNKYPISIIVIACNTISTISLSILSKKFNLPIIGVFPIIKTAQKITKNKVIGLIATKATINSDYMKNIIYQYFSKKNIIKIIATNKLAQIAEEKSRGLLVSHLELKKILQPWMSIALKPDTIILGCTHFSLLKQEIKKVLNQSISFVDPKKETIQHIKRYFDKNQINQKIHRNIFLYSQYNKNLKNLLIFLKKYNFTEIKKINLN